MGVSTSKNPELIAKAMERAKSIVSSKPVVIFSKTYCPYCTQVKQLLTRLGTKPEVIELDTESDGPDIQAALKEWTGQRTVPNVFIGGTHIGGCDDTVAKHNSGKLVPLYQKLVLFESCNASINMSTLYTLIGGSRLCCIFKTLYGCT